MYSLCVRNIKCESVVQTARCYYGAYCTLIVNYVHPRGWFCLVAPDILIFLIILFAECFVASDFVITCSLWTRI